MKLVDIQSWLKSHIHIRSKGQEEAPFQLLLAVAMLAMVLPITFYLFQQYQIWSSQERVQNNMEELAREIETVANLGSGEKYISVDLNVYGGPNFRVDGFDIYNPGQGTCLDYCHTPNCLLLRAYQNVSGKARLAGVPLVCIRVPFNVNFVTDRCPSNSLETLATDDFSNGNGPTFKPGYHTFVAVKKGYTVYFCTPKSTMSS